jgi:PA domain/FlgD Ig-like domain
MKTPARFPRPVLSALVALALFFPHAPARAATITIVNADGAGEGFNDPTPAAPVGGNGGTTVGQQRLIVFQTAANIWGSLLTSSKTIVVSSQFNALSCSSTSGVLGSAGPTTIHANFTGAEFSGYWYNVALANAESNADQNGATAEISAQFNSSVGLTGCLDGSSWYYGLDDNHGANGIDLLVVVLHEMGHGLGFLTTTDGGSGNFQSGLPALWDKFLFDESTGLHWDAETSTQRAASAISTNGLVWDGKAVNFMVPHVMSGRPQLVVTAPPGIAGTYQAAAASFGAALTTTGVTAPVVLGVDASAPVNDGCSALTNAASVAGKICLLDRGTCAFTLKADAAQAAGAVGLIIANNAAGILSPGGTDPTVTIPVVMITQTDGNTIKAQLGTGVTATIGLDPAHFAGAHDPDERLMMFAPNPIQPGSSVSHWDTSALPNLLMEPAINGDLTANVDMTRYLFEDIGWFRPRTTGVTPTVAVGSGIQGAPNPFRDVSTVSFDLSRSGTVECAVFDLEGRLVRHLTNAWMPAGTHALVWDGATDGGAPTPAGVYLTRLRGPDGTQTARLVHVR